MLLVNKTLRPSTTISSSNGLYRKMIRRWTMRRFIKAWRTWWKKLVIVFLLINLSFWKCYKKSNSRASINESMWSDYGIVIVVAVTNRAARVLRWTVFFYIPYSRKKSFRIKREKQASSIATKFRASPAKWRSREIRIVLDHFGRVIYQQLELSMTMCEEHSHRRHILCLVIIMFLATMTNVWRCEKRILMGSMTLMKTSRSEGDDRYTYVYIFARIDGSYMY